MITIRPAQSDDLTNLVALNDVVQSWHAAHYPDRFPACPEPDDVRSFFAALLTEETAYLDLAVDEGGAAKGYCFARLDARAGSLFTKPRRDFHIEHFAVDPAAQRCGIGRALMAQAEDRARALGCGAVNLTSWAANTAAHETFKATGFRPVRLWFEKTL